MDKSKLGYDSPVSISLSWPDGSYTRVDTRAELLKALRQGGTIEATQDFWVHDGWASRTIRELLRDGIVGVELKSVGIYPHISPDGRTSDSLVFNTLWKIFYAEEKR